MNIVQSCPGSMTSLPMTSHTKSSAAFTRVVALHRVIGYTWVTVKERTKRAKLKGNNCCGYYFLCVFKGVKFYFVC